MLYMLMFLAGADKMNDEMYKTRKPGISAGLKLAACNL